MSFTRTLEIKRGDCCPELGIAAAPGDMTAEVTYSIDSVEIVSDEAASARYKTFSYGVQTGLGRFEFLRVAGKDLFMLAEDALLKKVSAE
ncbi:TPA: hypothetical protein R2K49_004509 [Raoultella ornithinolytica]|nr:hypothetical protein [Raoultella ornithinolytica]